MSVIINSVYILGNHIQALGIARFAFSSGLDVSLYNSYGASVSRFSNTCKRFTQYRSETQLLELLNEEAPENKSCILFPTNDALVWFLKEHYSQLENKYHLAIPVPDSVEICYNKRLTYKKASDLGIPIPESYFPNDENELIAISEKLRYPVIIKPAIMHLFYQQTGKKVLKCNTKDELVINYRKIISYIQPNEVIVQELLAGGAPSLYSCGAVCYKGTILGSFVANRIRQKPMDFGISTTYAKAVLNAEISQQAQNYLYELKYTGMAEVEFMLDINTGIYKLIEINPRSWKWHYMIKILGVNFIDMLVKAMQDEKLEVFNNVQTNVAWIERLTDTYVVINEIIRRRLNIREYFRTLCIPKQSAVWSWKDPLPGIMYIILSPYLLFKRN